jgi:hypothetical protein
MFIRLYWNTSNRAITAMLRHVVWSILDSEHISAEYLTRQFSGQDEAGVLRALEVEWDGTAGYGRTSTIMELLKRPRPKPYKQLLDRFSRNWGEDKQEGRRKMTLFESMDARQLETLRIDFLARSSFNADDPSVVLFDYPSEGALKLGEDVLVEVTPGQERPLSEVSDIVSLLPTTFKDTCARLRVFHDPDLSKDRVKVLRGEVAEFLEELAGGAVI